LQSLADLVNHTEDLGITRNGCMLMRGCPTPDT
jgi:hypothetical protein